MVVRLDKSGTTHIFKAFLEQAGSTSPIEMEEFFENEPESAGKGQRVQSDKPAQKNRTWTQVAEGCENQRWPRSRRNRASGKIGNPGVIEKVGDEPNSIGYADLAVAREKNCSPRQAKAAKTRDPLLGAGVEQQAHQRRRSNTPNRPPTGTSKRLANSNCAKTVYALTLRAKNSRRKARAKTGRR